MTAIGFEKSDRSVGLEMEFQLVDGGTWDLVEGVLPLLELYPDSEYVKPEFIQSTVEVASAPCAGIAELAAHVAGLIAELDRNCRRLGYRLCSMGTHPFSREMASFTPYPRYLAIGEAAGYLGHNQITFATHVHVGVESGDEAIGLMGRLTPYLPILIAIGANSPFWRGEDTKFSSFRQRILAASRNYGLPPELGDWQSFERFYAGTKRAGVIASLHDIHWDIRPRPHLGTLEVRVMDAQKRASDALALATFVRTLVQYLREQPTTASPGLGEFVALPWWTHKDNCYSASRYGLEAQLMVNEAGDVASAMSLIDETLALIEPIAQSNGEDQYLDPLRETLSSGGLYEEQRRLFRQGGSFPAVVEAFAEGLVDDLPQLSHS